MLDHENTAKPKIDQKPARQQTEAEKDRIKRAVRDDIPDESKERHTEIAVEVGEKFRKQQNEH